MKAHVARKRFGQNFLQDPLIIDAIVRAANLERHDTVVEIGPGLGALTKPIHAQVNKLHVVEIDRDIIKRLKLEFPAESLVIHEGDALKFDFSTLGRPLKIIGNLPYNISTPLLFHLASFQDLVFDMHFMLQDEVVERMVAEPNSSHYGRLSVMLQYAFEMEKLFEVPPTAFTPQPKVNSAIVRLIPVPGRAGTVLNELDFYQLVLTAFSQRRKTLRNTLVDYFSPDDWTALQLDSGLRAESLSVDDYVRMANYVTQKNLRV
jgi:16S rRNA (adenine1518-N6/adenine1519-N6)-dimethyltransferase